MNVIASPNPESKQNADLNVARNKAWARVQSISNRTTGQSATTTNYLMTTTTFYNIHARLTFKVHRLLGGGGVGGVFGGSAGRKGASGGGNGRRRSPMTASSAATSVMVKIGVGQTLNGGIGRRNVTDGNIRGRNTLGWGMTVVLLLLL